MKKLLVALTFVAEIALYLMNLAMGRAWLITGDVFYYLMGNLMWVIGAALLGAWCVVIKYENHKEKARE